MQPDPGAWQQQQPEGLHRAELWGQELVACPGEELEWHQDLLSMVGVARECHIPKSLQ